MLLWNWGKSGCIVILSLFYFTDFKPYHFYLSCVTDWDHLETWEKMLRKLPPVLFINLNMVSIECNTLCMSMLCLFVICLICYRCLNQICLWSQMWQIKIWEDRKTQPLAILRPHDGNPVFSATFFTAPHQPDHIVLITAVSVFINISRSCLLSEFVSSNIEVVHFLW